MTSALEVQNRILEVAGSQFFSLGFTKVTMDEIAHEIAHVELGHCRKALIQKNRTEALQLFLSLANRRPGTAASIVQHLAKLGISRESELEADDFAVQLLLKSRYSPIGLVQFLERAKKREHIPEWMTFLSTHPGNNERIGRLRQKVGIQ